ncbi:hypothetical protein P9112_010410 [Eukaryota sp. TZLM1-RC]
MKLALLFVTICCAVFAENIITDCSGPDAAIRLEEYSISPDYIVKGGNVTISAKGALLRDITDGATAQVKVKFGAIPVIRETYDICRQAKEFDLPIQCPVPAQGQVLAPTTMPLPDEVLPGKYTASIKAKLADGTELTCMNAQFEVHRH